MQNTLLVVVLGSGLLAAASPRWAPRILTGTAAAAVGLAVIGLVDAPAELGPVSTAGLGGLVLVLTTVTGATVMGFASRALRHEPYQHRFATLGPLLMTSAALVAIADHHLLLALAWSATSALTIALLRTGPSATTASSARRATKAFLVGDVALAAGLVGFAVDAPTWLAGSLVLVAAAARSAVGPFMRWLPDSLAAPTPTSALLHGGVVNGGPLLLLQLAPEMGGSLAVSIATVAVGALSCLFAEAVMLTRPDVKGRLAWSTVAQMSFTTTLCGLGLPIAAGLHLVAHGFYKANLLLGSGSAVRTIVRQRQAPHLAGRPSTVAVSAIGLGAPIAAAVAVTAALDIAWTPELAIPVGLGAIAAFQATRAALLHVSGVVGGAIAAAAIAAALALFALVVASLDHAIADQTDPVASTLSSLWILPLVAALALVAATRSRRHGAGAIAAAWDVAERFGQQDAWRFAPATARTPGVPVPPGAPGALDPRPPAIDRPAPAGGGHDLSGAHA